MQSDCEFRSDSTRIGQSSLPNEFLLERLTFHQISSPQCRFASGNQLSKTAFSKGMEVNGAMSLFARGIPPKIRRESKDSKFCFKSKLWNSKLEQFTISFDSFRFQRPIGIHCKTFSRWMKTKCKQRSSRTKTIRFNLQSTESNADDRGELWNGEPESPVKVSEPQVGVGSTKMRWFWLQQSFSQRHSECVEGARTTINKQKDRDLSLERFECNRLATGSELKKVKET